MTINPANPNFTLLKPYFQRDTGLDVTKPENQGLYIAYVQAKIAEQQAITSQATLNTMAQIHAEIVEIKKVLVNIDKKVK